MAYSFNGTDTRFTCAPPQRGFATMTVSMWFRSNSTAYSKTFGVWDGTVYTMHEWLLQIGGSNKIGVACTNLSDQYSLPNSANDIWTAGTWHHYVMRITGAAHQGILNGVVVATGAWTTTTRSGSTSVMSIGGGHTGTTSEGVFAGDLAELAIYPVSLSDAEINSLKMGRSPARVRPQSLLFYAPLARAVSDLKKGVTFTQFGSPTVADHPRIYR